jgi:hypothetical protein
MPFRGNMYIFKENSVWRMSRIGGRFIFAFDEYWETTGLLTSRCVCNVRSLGQQVVWTPDDILVHNGQTQRSILERKWRRTLFADMDPVTYINSFVFDNPIHREVWFCYPTNGFTMPNKALIWNYSSGDSFSTTDVDFVNVAQGRIEDPDPITWEANDAIWNSTDEPWDIARRQGLIACFPEQEEFRRLDDGVTRAGTRYVATLERKGLALIGRKRSGQWIVNHKVYKTSKKLWLKVTGGSVAVRVGSQDLVDGPISWGPKQVFHPNRAMWLDVIKTGRALAIEVSSVTDENWSLQGYKIELNVGGNY